MPVPGLDAGEVNSRTKTKTEILLFLNLVFCCCFCFFNFFFNVVLFICFIIVEVLFLFLFFFSLYYRFSHHHLLIPTLTPFTLPPAPVLKSIAPFPTTLSAPSHPLSSLSSPSPPNLPQPVTRLPLLPTYSPPANQPIIPTLHNPKPLQSLTQTPYTTVTEIHQNTHKGHITQQPTHDFPHTYPTSWLPF
jgi:hypothetical protein